MYRDSIEAVVIAADDAAELAAAMQQDDDDAFMRNIADIDTLFARVDPVMQTKLDFCTGLEVLCGIRIEYDVK